VDNGVEVSKVLPGPQRPSRGHRPGIVPRLVVLLHQCNTGLLVVRFRGHVRGLQNKPRRREGSCRHQWHNKHDGRAGVPTPSILPSFAWETPARAPGVQYSARIAGLVLEDAPASVPVFGAHTGTHRWIGADGPSAIPDKHPVTVLCFF
jgi:hypothetical protein